MQDDGIKSAPPAGTLAAPGAKTRKVSTAVYRGADGMPLAQKTVANIKARKCNLRTRAYFPQT